MGLLCTGASPGTLSDSEALAAAMLRSECCASILEVATPGPSSLPSRAECVCFKDTQRAARQKGQEKAPEGGENGSSLQPSGPLNLPYAINSTNNHSHHGP